MSCSSLSADAPPAATGVTFDLFMTSAEETPIRLYFSADFFSPLMFFLFFLGILRCRIY